jgi:hypothetical protein
MALHQPFGKDFDLHLSANRPEVSVTFRPTLAHYVFTIITDSAEKARIGSALADGCHGQRETTVGGYDDAEVEKEARRLALALAEKIVRGS